MCQSLKGNGYEQGSKLEVARQQARGCKAEEDSGIISKSMGCIEELQG
jgi:hypothetical protein